MSMAPKPEKNKNKTKTKKKKEKKKRKKGKKKTRVWSSVFIRILACVTIIWGHAQYGNLMEAVGPVPQKM